MALFAERKLSPVELTEASLDRIERLDARLGAFTTVCAEEALRASRVAERELANGGPRSPLHGIPIAVKDLVEIAGLPLEAGSGAMRGFVASRDAPIVTRLKEAGAIIVGKTSLDEFALTTLGPAKNPLDERRSPGGSSGGSGAAVAAGMCLAAIGTDSGGSIRIPAACCGIVGLKPTYGRVPKRGVVALAWSLDHIGPMARHVADAAAMLQVIAGHDPEDWSTAELPVPSYAPTASTLEGIRVGVPQETYLESVHPPILAAFEQTLEVLSELGAQRVSVELPSVDIQKDVHYVVLIAELAAYHLRLGTKLSDYGEAVRVGIDIGSKITAHDYLSAQRVRGRIAEGVSAALREADVVALPTMAFEAPLIGQHTVELAGRQEEVVAAMVRFTSTFNHTGHPAAAIPAGTTESGLPASLQLVARRFDEPLLLEVAAVVEAAISTGGRIEDGPA
jgi:aspartyl-tRNA(Asn)/glutamyl-tRNA(Gln) amidotransferase subunit A